MCLLDNNCLQLVAQTKIEELNQKIQSLLQIQQKDKDIIENKDKLLNQTNSELWSLKSEFEVLQQKFNEVLS